MVLFREGYVYFARFACVLADQLLFEVADEGMGTDRQIVVGALAAFESYAVDEAFIVDYSDVAILYRTLHNYSSGVVFLLLL